MRLTHFDINKLKIKRKRAEEKRKTEFGWKEKKKKENTKQFLTETFQVNLKVLVPVGSVILVRDNIFILWVIIKVREILRSLDLKNKKQQQINR